MEKAWRNHLNSKENIKFNVSLINLPWFSNWLLSWGNLSSFVLPLEKSCPLCMGSFCLLQDNRHLLFNKLI